MAANKGSTSPSPLMPSAPSYMRSDQEAAASAPPSAAELRHKKHMRCLLYVTIISIFQVVVLTVFALTVMKINSPKFRVRSATIIDIKVGNATSPTFDLEMDVHFGVKNTNFGYFKYKDGYVLFSYGGVRIGQTNVEEERVRARSTRKVDVSSVSLTSSAGKPNSRLGSDISTGVIPITVSSKLDGKIHLMKVIKKKKSAQMNCNMEVVLATKSVQNIVCK
ncbi:late embryogenesis abundant protein At1g64065-like [Argentina anserina]|uniref:late embryogenesis abundant protein At1g64065-like n=1 Tax=Argentina anserina TaxID=57926 RepID=UPI0021767816|nr:late embryogenesis abundant protein At1g64065-like [Potentilla anserina]